MFSLRLLLCAFPALIALLLLVNVGEAVDPPERPSARDYAIQLLAHDIREHLTSFEDYPNTLASIALYADNQLDVIFRRNHLLARADTAMALLK